MYGECMWFKKKTITNGNVAQIASIVGIDEKIVKNVNVVI